MGDNEGEVLRGTFPSLMAEGTMLSRRGELSKALSYYTFVSILYVDIRRSRQMGGEK